MSIISGYVIKGSEVKKGDRFFKNGNDDFAQEIKVSQKWTVITGLHSTLRIENDAEITIQRDEDTPEEVWLKAYVRNQEVRESTNANIFDEAVQVANKLDKAKGELAIAAMRNDTFRLGDAFDKVMKCEAEWNVYLRVLLTAAHASMDLVDATNEALEEMKNELLSRGIDDSWSNGNTNTSNAVKRMQWEVTRNMVARHSFGSYLGYAVIVKRNAQDLGF